MHRVSLLQTHATPGEPLSVVVGGGMVMMMMMMILVMVDVIASCRLVG